MAFTPSEIAFYVAAPTAAFVTTFFIGVAIFSQRSMLDASFSRPETGCKSVEQVVDDQTISPNIRVMQLGKGNAERFVTLANAHIEPNVTADEALIFRDNALAFALVVLFVDGCATNYGKIDVRQLKDWLEELF